MRCKIKYLKIFTKLPDFSLLISFKRTVRVNEKVCIYKNGTVYRAGMITVRLHTYVLTPPLSRVEIISVKGSKRIQNIRLEKCQ